LSQWDTAQDASEFFEAYQNWLEKKKFSPNSKDPENDIFVNSQEGQVAACVLKGSQVTVIGARDVATEEFESIVREVFPKTKAEVVKPKPSKTVSSEPERPARVSTASDVSKDVSQKPSLELSLDDLNMSKEVLPSVMAFGGLLAGLIGVAFIPLLVLYIYICLTLQIMAKKTETSNAWMAWIPVLNLFLIPRIAQKPAWWGLLLLVPLLGVVIMAIIGLKIAERRNKPGWIGILVIIPVINLFVLGYLAFSKDGSKAKKEEPAKEETKENNTENKE